MKKNISILISGILFAVLFYSQKAGLNFALYALLQILVLAILQPDKILKKAVPIVTALLWLASGIAVMWHGSLPSILTYFSTGISFIGAVALYNGSVYYTALNGLYNILMGAFHHVIYDLPREKATKSRTASTGHILTLIVIPVLLIIVFTLLYSNSNPVFENWLARVDLSFINLGWIMMVLLGSWITYNIATPHPITESIEESKISNDLNRPKDPNTLPINKFKKEIQIAVVSLIALNVLLLIVLVSDAFYIINISSFSVQQLSAAVHHGVNRSVISILLAIGMIIILYRGDLNFLKANRHLKMLTYLWLVLNAILLATILLKNLYYVDYAGLTFKRIGVIIYLILCSIGLVSTYIKIGYLKNMRFMIRFNMTAAVVTLSLFSFPNWSALITQFNISHNHNDLSLHYTMMPENIVVLRKNQLLEKTINKRIKQYHHARHGNLKPFVNRTWQSFNYTAYLYTSHE